MNRFVIAEPNKCIGCRTCEVACALAHPLGDGTAQALSPANFKPRLRLVKNLKTTAPVQCRQCENAPCVNACPTKALVYRSGTVQLIESRCIGCQTCVLACPFGAMDVIQAPVAEQNLGSSSVRSTISVAHKCDLCIDVATGPACIPSCPTGSCISAAHLGVVLRHPLRLFTAVHCIASAACRNLAKPCLARKKDDGSGHLLSMSTDVSASAKLISSTSRKLTRVWCWFHQKPARLV